MKQLLLYGVGSLWGLSLGWQSPATAQLDSPLPPNDPVPSVRELTDVQPTDWAYEALQALFQRYGVISGYPDGTFRGNRPLTRYEFAAALLAVFERVQEERLVNGQVPPEDLATLQRLFEEYLTGQAILRGRVDAVTARIIDLEAFQFATATKLFGQAIFALNAGAFTGDAIFDPTGNLITEDQPDATVLYRVALDFNTSFFGTDLLKLRLDTGSDGSDDNVAGFLEPTFGSILDFSDSPPTDRDIRLGRLYYSFLPAENLLIALGPVIVPTDFVDRNTYAGHSFLDFSTEAFVYNPTLFPIDGPSGGAFLDWSLGESFQLRALYAAAGADQRGELQDSRAVSSFSRFLYPEVDGDGSLIGDTRQGMVELEYSPSPSLALRLQYSGGRIFDRRFDVIGANLEWTLSSQVGMFGRYGYGSYQDTEFGDINPNYWMAGVSVKDILFEGAIAGFAVGQPAIAQEIGTATQTNLEAFYNLPITDNITITPLVQVITNPGNRDENGTIFTGTLRTVFVF